MTQWNTDTRGQNRADEESYYENTGYDAYSCMELMGLPGSSTGIADIEDPGVVSDLPAGVEEDES